MKNSVKKLTLGANLAALSVVLNLVFSYIVNMKDFGFPFYGIPLMLAGLYFGPIYGFIVSLVADTVFGFAGPFGYMPLYTLSSLAWGVIPALFKKRNHISYYVFVVLLTYIVATLGNSFANYSYFGFNAMMGTLYLRLGLIPLFAPIIAIVTKLIYDRTKTLIPEMIPN